MSVAPFLLALLLLTLNQVWQVGPVSGGSIAPHTMGGDNHAAKGKLNLVTGATTAGTGGGDLLHKKNVVVVRMGPCCGGGGNARDVDMSGVDRVVKVALHHGDTVDAMSVLYERSGREEWTDLWGGPGGGLSEICLRPDEYFTGVEGHCGEYEGHFVVRSLTFVSNLCAYGPYGAQDGVPFALPAAGGKILGFHARSGDHLDALGTYVKVEYRINPLQEGPDLDCTLIRCKMGYAIIILGIVNIFKGMSILTVAQKWKTAYTIAICVLGAVALILEAVTWAVVLKRRKSESKTYDGRLPLSM